MRDPDDRPVPAVRDRELVDGCAERARGGLLDNGAGGNGPVADRHHGQCSRGSERAIRSSRTSIPPTKPAAFAQ